MGVSRRQGGAGESHEQALRREMQEELGTDVEVRAAVSTAAHAYDDRHVTLHFYRCDLAGDAAAAARTGDAVGDARGAARAGLSAGG